MKKNISVLVALFCSAAVFSQVGINNDTPKATMDITAKTTDGSKPEGIIAPRLTGDQIKSADAQYGSDQRGAIVYALAAVSTSSTKTANITGEGYYFFDGNIWQSVGSGIDTSIYKGSGSLSGNTVVTQNANTLSFTGSATNAFSVDGSTFSVDASNNRVGIGTTAPSVALEINNGNTAGAIKITDGTQGDGKVLTSDANGLGTWKNKDANPIFTTTTATSGGPYDLTAFVSCRSSTAGNGITINVNGNSIAVAQGMSGLTVSVSTVVPRGAVWSTNVGGGNNCTIMRY